MICRRTWQLRITSLTTLNVASIIGRVAGYRRFMAAIQLAFLNLDMAQWIYVPLVATFRDLVYGLLAIVVCTQDLSTFEFSLVFADQFHWWKPFIAGAARRCASFSAHVAAWSQHLPTHFFAACELVSLLGVTRFLAQVVAVRHLLATRSDTFRAFYLVWMRYSNVMLRVLPALKWQRIANELMHLELLAAQQ